jgi:hypothetical protein
LTCATRCEEELVNYVDEMKIRRPVIFLDAISPRSFGFPDLKFRHENYPALNKFVSENYTQVGDVDSERVFVLDSRLAMIDSLDSSQGEKMICL